MPKFSSEIPNPVDAHQDETCRGSISPESIRHPWSWPRSPLVVAPQFSPAVLDLPPGIQWQPESLPQADFFAVV
ncbi:MAG: hypothetical protein CBB71_03510 [Rhodopirellula sp. TMED11]|nr:MAG: hypothetical protein CBB71_03510 [Rhodopirellula sp. TMED11]